MNERLFGGRNPLNDHPVFSEDIVISGLESSSGEHKIQKIFVSPDRRLLMITSDGIGAFDQKHKLPDGKPAHVCGKGVILTAFKKWGKELAMEWGVPTDYVPMDEYLHLIPSQWQDRFSAHEPADERLAVECVVRSSCEGSQAEGAAKGESVCGHELPPGGLTFGQMLPYPMFTPTTKEPAGKKDLPITIPEFYARVGYHTGTVLYSYSIYLHLLNRVECLRRGLDRPDQKLEFGWQVPHILDTYSVK